MTRAVRLMIVVQNIVSDPATGHSISQGIGKRSVCRDLARRDLPQQIVQLPGQVGQVAKLFADPAGLTHSDQPFKMPLR